MSLLLPSPLFFFQADNDIRRGLPFLECGGLLFHDHIPSLFAPRHIVRKVLLVAG
eukprot:COSAG05_NODE_19916_length_286_cov_0.219251_1_plen_54_part_10